MCHRSGCVKDRSVIQLSIKICEGVIFVRPLFFVLTCCWYDHLMRISEAFFIDRDQCLISSARTCDQPSLALMISALGPILNAQSSFLSSFLIHFTCLVVCPWVDRLKLVGSKIRWKSILNTLCAFIHWALIYSFKRCQYEARYNYVRCWIHYIVCCCITQTKRVWWSGPKTEFHMVKLFPSHHITIILGIRWRTANKEIGIKSDPYLG